MTRGVKAGTKRGPYKRFNISLLRRLAKDVRKGSLDREIVAQAFESSGRIPDAAIARAIRAGREFDSARLANAIEAIGTPTKISKATKRLPLSVAKAALKHQRGMPLIKATGATYPYGDDASWRSYLKRLNADYGKRRKQDIELKLANKWSDRTPRQFPDVELAIRRCLSGEGVPLEIHQAQARRTLRKKVEPKI